MTDVTFRFSNPTATGADVPAEGYVECSLVVVEHDGTGTRTVERFAVDITNGVGIAALSPTAVGQAWRLAVKGIAGVGTFYKAVPASTIALRYETLVEVDPDSRVLGSGGVWPRSIISRCSRITLSGR